MEIAISALNKIDSPTGSQSKPQVIQLVRRESGSRQLELIRPTGAKTQEEKPNKIFSKKVVSILLLLSLIGLGSFYAYNSHQFRSTYEGTDEL